MCPRGRPQGQGRPRRLHLCIQIYYLHYFLANCDRKNPISDLVGYFTTACKQAMLRNCSRRLRPVATFRELSMTSNFGCFASLRVASRCFALLRIQSKRTFNLVRFSSQPQHIEI